MKFAGITSALFVLASVPAWSAHWKLVGVQQPSTLTWILSGQQGVPVSSTYMDTAAIAGPTGVYGNQKITYYGYGSTISAGKGMPISQFTDADSASAPMVFTFEYVQDSPSDPLPTVGDNYDAGAYNIRRDSAVTSSPETDFIITGQCSFGHQFPAANTFTFSQNGGPGNIGSWPTNTDPTAVVGGSGYLYDYTSSYYGSNPCYLSGGNYYVTVNVPFQVIYTCSGAASVPGTGAVTTALMRVGMGDTDLLGFGQVWNYPVEY